MHEHVTHQLLAGRIAEAARPVACELLLGAAIHAVARQQRPRVVQHRVGAHWLRPAVLAAASLHGFR